MTSPVAAPLAVSFGKVDITPSPANGTTMGGYAVDTPRTATSARSPLWARCLILWDNGAPNVLVSVDVLALGPTLHNNIRSRVLALHALAGTANFVITVTHTHNGPVLPEVLNPYTSYNMSGNQLRPVQTYANTFADKVVNLVRTTLASQRFACTLDYQVKKANFAGNREWEESYVETDVPVLVARDTPAGTPRAVLFGYGCHPVSAGQRRQLDPDFPGAAIKLIEANGGPFAQFLVGPAGDQNPLNIIQNLGGGSFPDADNYGKTLANLVSAALKTPGRSISGPIHTGYQEVSMPLDITDDPNNLAAVRAAYVSRQTNNPYGYFRRHAELMIGQIDNDSFDTTIPLPQQVWRLGGQGPGLPGASGLLITFIGGEPIAGFGAYFRNAYGGSQNIWFNGYANEILCYIPSDGLCRDTGISYACGFTADDFPGIAGGAMTVYAHLGHLVYRATAGSRVNGVEQVVIDGLTKLIANT